MAAADSDGAVNRFPAQFLTRTALSAALLALPLAGVGCQGTRLADAYTEADDFKAFVGVAHADDPETADTLYRVAAPDTLHITVLRDGETADHRVTLPPDGRLLLPGLAWPVDATGLTPGEIAQDLEHALNAQAAQDTPDEPATGVDADAATPVGPLANHPLDLDPETLAQAQRQRLGGADPVHVAVRVEGFTSRRVFVFGQVTDPGAQAWDGSNRLSSVLTNARPGHRADLTRVLVLRPGLDGDPRRRLVIAAQHLLETGDTKLDVALDAGDVVFVPATPLGRVGLALDRLRPNPQAQAAWSGERPGPFFPEIAMIARADAVDAPLDDADHADLPPDHDATSPVLTQAAADGVLDLADAGDQAHAAVDPLAAVVAHAPAKPEDGLTDAEPLLQIRVDTPSHPPTASDPRAAEPRQAAAEEAVRFWAP